ncbi:uncharacterized protein BT62DRAFT_1060589 [Guyanagaster necrorhizus]|uniref:Uncharacterized protein n=1 Tax=Guyanagaster necrorhizus TaxID=856835 RepID=A0A9P8ATR3_9AGAR|nr:uncharacterized protein BT62DRAFT_1060589 [Guyanagaster necrorhizus MCA 3950]KAG7447485.1 hypothetical protein BT62DRAFT_1060589 [Guyanagaster necrorhizus MCA 3950]
MKWYFMLMCFTWVCKDGSSERLMALLLSYNRGVESFCSKLSPDNSALIQIATFIHSHAVTYSASHDDVATVCCFLAFHKIMSEPRVKQLL